MFRTLSFPLCFSSIAFTEVVVADQQHTVLLSAFPNHPRFPYRTAAALLSEDCHYTLLVILIKENPLSQSAKNQNVTWMSTSYESCSSCELTKVDSRADLLSFFFIWVK